MVSESRPSHGLTHAELALAIGELDAELRGATVLDVALLKGSDDLLLVLQDADGDRRQKLHVAPGGVRARLCTTRRRFRREEFATGPAVDSLRATLVDRTVRACRSHPGERRCTVDLGGEPALRLEVELFGPRGLWCLVDDGGRIRELSRQVRTKTRTLRRDDAYAPPPPAPPGSEAPPVRFESPVLPAVDALFTRFDLEEQSRAEVELLQRAIARGQRKARSRIEGLRTQQREIGRADALRREADLMLSYGHEVRRGADSMSVPDPDSPGEVVEISLDPSKALPDQARARYDRARKLEESTAIAAERLAAAELELAELQELAARASDDAEGEVLEGVRAVLQQRGLLPRPATPSDRKVRKDKKLTAGENVRRFASAEGYPILVGRNNAQNDRLSMRIARGNDLWFHVGGGRAGSHVVVRLPKGKTASLETMLDAGTLAIHFSKARGERLCEALYTQAKHVRKPKGLPPGRVVPSRTKTIAVRLDEDRLRRLLDSAES